MQKLLWAAALMACACAGSARAQAPVRPPIVLKVHHFLPPGSNTHAKLLAPWCERIERETVGRLKCQLFPSMQLGGTPQQLYDQVRDGVADVVWTLPGYTANRFPMMEVFELPFISSQAEATSKAAWEFYEKHPREELREVKPLAIHVHDAGYVHTREKQIRVLADFRGLKLRAPTRQTNRLLAALGATPVSMPVTGLADAIGKGVLDGAMIPWEVVPAVRVHEVVRYHTETDSNVPAMYTAVFLLAMNKRAYDDLPADLRGVIDRNSGAALSAQAGRIWDEATAPARKLAVDRGNTVYVVPAAELAGWQRAAQPVIVEWVADMNRRKLNGDALLADARAMIARNSPGTRQPVASTNKK